MDLKPSYVHGASSAPLIGDTIGAHFDRVAARHAPREALVVRHQEVRWTWAQLKRRVDNLACALRRLNLARNVRLLPYLPQAQLWELFQRAEISASISTHDGTPNTLLEAMACGCFPVGGDLEALREWLTPGVNGLLVEAGKPQALAEALLLALEQPGLRSRAAEINRGLVRERAEISAVRGKLASFYHQFEAGEPEEAQPPEPKPVRRPIRFIGAR